MSHSKKSHSAATPHIDFQTFLLSLASSGMVHLGRVPDPHGGENQVNLPMARQTIDILSMLREKTQGNLDATEALLLERVLHDLRLAWVEESKDKIS